MSMRTAISLLASLLLNVTPALATGTIDCTIADAGLTLDASAAVRDGPGGHFSRFDGKLEIKAKGVPDALRKLEFKLDDLTQRWLHGNELKLRLYRDRGGDGPSAEVDLAIEARRAGKDKLDYNGSYILTVSHVVAGEEKIVTVRGRTKCTAA
jgi:hypothetical protein